ncbi:MAG: HNH endonuclease [Acutalibacteraceae bacterium]|nr:HNH endonuclease [Acutalibacteraceae bacterium]
MKSRRSKATDISQRVKKKVWDRDRQCCVICGNPQAMPNAHYISRAKGGLGIEENVVTLCQTCHHRYDNGDMQEEYKDKIESYLKSMYKDWNKNNLIYKKY